MSTSPKVFDVEFVQEKDYFSINFFDFDEQLLVSIKGNSNRLVQIYSFAPSLQIERVIPHAVSAQKYEEIDLSYIICFVPPGKNFFDVDFTEFNRLLGLPAIPQLPILKAKRKD